MVDGPNQEPTDPRERAGWFLRKLPAKIADAERALESYHWRLFLECIGKMSLYLSEAAFSADHLLLLVQHEAEQRERELGLKDA